MGLLFENPMQLFQFCFVNYLWEFTITVKNKQIQDYIQKKYNYLKNEANICWNASVYNFKKECHPMNTVCVCVCIHTHTHTHTHIHTYIPSTGGVTFLPMVMDAFSSYIISSGDSST